MNASGESNENLQRLLDQSHQNLFLDIGSHVQADINGLTRDQQNILHFYGASIISDACQYLQLPIATCVSAQTIFHRFYTRCSFLKHDLRDVAMGSLFLAGKAQETIKKPRDIAYVFDQIFKIEEGNSRPVELIDDKSYKFNRMKQVVQEMEREILKELGFELYQITWNEQPHRLMYFYINLFKPNPGNQSSYFQNLTRTAFNYLNDSYKTNLCVLLPFQVIVASCIYLAFRSQGIQMPRIPWWTIMETSIKHLKMGAGKIQSIYNQFQTLPKYLDCCVLLNHLALHKNISKHFDLKYHELPEKNGSLPQSLNNMISITEAIAKSKLKQQLPPSRDVYSNNYQPVDASFSSDYIDKMDQHNSNLIMTTTTGTSSSEYTGVGVPQQGGGFTSFNEINSLRETKYSKFSHQTSPPVSQDVKEKRKRSRSNSHRRKNKRKSSSSRSYSKNRDRKSKDNKQLFNRRSRSRDHRERSHSNKGKKRRNSKSVDRKKSHKKTVSSPLKPLNKFGDKQISPSFNNQGDSTTLINGSYSSAITPAISSTPAATLAALHSQISLDIVVPLTKVNLSNESVKKGSDMTPELIKEEKNRSVSAQKKDKTFNQKESEIQAKKRSDESSSLRKESKDKDDKKKKKKERSRSRSHNKKSKKHHAISPDDKEKERKRKRSKEKKHHKENKRSKSQSQEKSNKFTVSSSAKNDIHLLNQGIGVPFTQHKVSPQIKQDKFSSAWSVIENSNDFSQIPSKINNVEDKPKLDSKIILSDSSYLSGFNSFSFPGQPKYPINIPTNIYHDESRQRFTPEDIIQKLQDNYNKGYSNRPDIHLLQIKERDDEKRMQYLPSFHTNRSLYKNTRLEQMRNKEKVVLTKPKDNMQLNEEKKQQFLLQIKRTINMKKPEEPAVTLSQQNKEEQSIQTVQQTTVQPSNMKPKLELLNSKIAFKIKPTNPCIQNISHISQNNLSSEGDKKANDIETNESEDDYLNQLRIKRAQMKQKNSLNNI